MRIPARRSWGLLRPARPPFPDDVLDAAACALAARDMLKGRATRLPPAPRLDARGLKMEIWY